MIYFIQCGGYVKIGYCARDPIRRLEKLQIGNPLPLTLLALMEGGLVQEKEWHVRYRKQHVRGEWFTLTPQMIRGPLYGHLVDHDDVSRRRPARKIAGVDAHLIQSLLDNPTAVDRVRTKLSAAEVSQLNKEPTS